MCASGSQGCPREDVASKYPEPCCGFLFCCCPLLLNRQCDFNTCFDNKMHIKSSMSQVCLILKRKLIKTVIFVAMICLLLTFLTRF